MYKGLGILFLGLAVLGATLPVLPTTPFVLLAASCFAKSSPKLYQKLVSNKKFGPLILRWEQEGSIPLRAKILACLMMVGFGSYGILVVVENPHFKLLGTVFIFCGMAFVLTRPTSFNHESKALEAVPFELNHNPKNPCQVPGECRD